MTAHAPAAPEPLRLRFEGIAPPGVDDFKRDVIAGLGGESKSIPCKYLYDAKGSQLFDQICDLPEYYPTRTELSLTRTHAADIAEAIGTNAQIIEPGAGSTTKIRILLDALDSPAAYFPVDISGEHLRGSAKELAGNYPNVYIDPVVADFTRPFEVLVPQDLEGSRVIYFPGSTIGNFERDEAVRLLASFGEQLRPNDFVLLGWDRIKDAQIVVPAYSDADGVTAAFTKNLMHRVERDLGADFDSDAFDLVTEWQVQQERIRIALRSRTAQVVKLDEHEFSLSKDEEVLIEYSHKYSDDSMRRIARDAGLEWVRNWTDTRAWFALTLLRPSA